MLHRLSTHTIAFSLGVLALGMFQAALPPAPAWVDQYCTDSSPCQEPSEVYQGLALALDWFESDGTPCPEPATGEHPQTPCGPNAFIGHWVMLTRGDVHHGNAVDHDVFYIANSPIYGGPELGSSPIPASAYAHGNVIASGLSPAATQQAPALPVLDPAGWFAWFEAACAASPTCGAGGLTQAEFDALMETTQASRITDLEASISTLAGRVGTVEAFNASHVHDIDPAVLTIAGQTVSTSTGHQ